MLHKARLGGDVERGDEVSPTEQLATKGAAIVDFDGEIGQTEDALAGEAEARQSALPESALRPIHLIADHQDLLVDRETSPPLRRKGGVLRHSASTRPLSAASTMSGWFGFIVASAPRSRPQPKSAGVATMGILMKGAATGSELSWGPAVRERDESNTPRTAAAHSRRSPRAQDGTGESRTAETAGGLA